MRFWFLICFTKNRTLLVKFKLTILALGRPRGIGWRGRWEGGSGWGIHVYPWLIHVNVWQQPLQYCKIISLQLKKINKYKNINWQFYFIKVCVFIDQSCSTLCDLMGYSPSDSAAHGILQARILEWVAIPFSRGCSPLRDQTHVSCIAGRFFTVWASRWPILNK